MKAPGRVLVGLPQESKRGKVECFASWFTIHLSSEEYEKYMRGDRRTVLNAVTSMWSAGAAAGLSLGQAVEIKDGVGGAE